MLIALLAAATGLLLWMAWVGRAGLVALQIFQIEEYELPRLLAWGRQPAWLWPRAALIGAGVALSAGLASWWLPAPATDLAAGLGLILGAIPLWLLWRRVPAKKPLVYTPRVRRMLGAAALVLFVLSVLLLLLLLRLTGLPALILVALLCLLAPGLALLLPPLGDWLMAPVEAAVRRGFLRRARARIVAQRPQVVGIAGSYGKTSTKHISAQLLGSQIETLATPKSFNTLMGITRTINEYLQPQHRLFLVEMDAYAAGEISAMCRLVEPQIAIITSVGPQHLERFGTVERIGAAIYELVAALPPGSPALIYADDPASAKLAERAAAAGYQVLRYGLAADASTLDIIADQVQISERLTRFRWRWPALGLEEQVAIPLLGQHNILNVSAALALTQLLGFSVADAAAAAAKLEPIPHRLQLLPSSGGVTVIDDSYNANPVGVHNGLDVLAQLRARQRILVTPGLVELGSVEQEENLRYGEHAAQVCDHVILVGARQTRPIQQGLRQAGFAAERLHVVESLAEVTALLARLSGPGDVVLFANDLPDTYLELS